MVQLRTALATLGALTALGLLAGCSKDAPATPATAPPTRSTTPATTPAATPPASSAVTPTSTATRQLPLPEQDELSRTFTQDGASAFASYYVRVLNYARNSGDTEPLRAISDPGCSGCQYDISEVQGFLDHGYSHVGLETQFRGTWYRSWDPEIGEIQMDVTVNRTANTVIDENGTEIEQVPALSDGTFFLWLKWLDGHWVVWEAQ